MFAFSNVTLYYWIIERQLLFKGFKTIITDHRLTVHMRVHNRRFSLKYIPSLLTKL